MSDLTFDDFLKRVLSHDKLPITTEDALTMFAPDADYRGRASLRSSLNHHLNDNPGFAGKYFVPGHRKGKKAQGRPPKWAGSLGFQEELFDRPVFTTSGNLPALDTLKGMNFSRETTSEVIAAAATTLATSPVKTQRAINSVLKATKAELEDRDRRISKAERQNELYETMINNMQESDRAHREMQQRLLDRILGDAPLLAGSPTAISPVGRQ